MKTTKFLQVLPYNYLRHLYLKSIRHGPYYGGRTRSIRDSRKTIIFRGAELSRIAGSTLRLETSHADRHGFCPGRTFPATEMLGSGFNYSALSAFFIWRHALRSLRTESLAATNSQIAQFPIICGLGFLTDFPGFKKKEEHDYFITIIFAAVRPSRRYIITPV